MSEHWVDIEVALLGLAPRRDIWNECAFAPETHRTIEPYGLKILE